MTHVCLDQPEGHLEQDGGGGVEEQLGDVDKLCRGKRRGKRPRSSEL